ncbi:MAG TPA: sugar phosphate nucleotidyltransferase [Steroidobacter sp.]|jgi:dTDP-glucose pyrophosphorylase|nr:sugar phosphate nucleotidyltransferase [Steroidobacter sp.]
MWGVIPAAGRGSRIQPLAFSKELLPVGSRALNDVQRPCAVSEYVVERLIRGGANKVCFVIGSGKSDILEYFGGQFGSADLVYVVQPQPAGLCDAIFRAHPLIDDKECVAVGLPDTVWFPDSALASLPDDQLSFLLFPVDQPQFFDAVALDEQDRVLEIRVKQPNPGTRWIWGAFKMPGRVFHELRALWLKRNPQDEYIGTLVNAYLAAGGAALGCKQGRAYVDVGTLEGYRSAMLMLSDPPTAERDEALQSRQSRAHNLSATGK